MDRRQFLAAAGCFAGLHLLGAPGWAQADETPYDFSTYVPGPQFSWDTAKFAWQFARLAYVPLTGPTTPLGIPPGELRSWDSGSISTEHDTQAIAWLRDDVNVIAFRGTEADKIRQGLERWQFRSAFRDARTDLEFGPAPVGAPGSGMTVHSGFKKAVEEAWEDWLKAIVENGKPSVFIGHSLGAALTTYAAFLARATSPAVMAVYSFASPRVGNDHWAGEYNRLLGLKTFRFANPADLVTRLPFRGASDSMLTPYLPKKILQMMLPPYRHVGQPIILSVPPVTDWNKHSDANPITWEVAKTFFKSSQFEAHLGYAKTLNAAAEAMPGLVPTLQPEPGSATWKAMINDIMQSSAQYAGLTVPLSRARLIHDLPVLQERIKRDPSILRRAVEKHARD